MKKFLTMLVIVCLALWSFSPLAFAGDNDARLFDAYDVDSKVALIDSEGDSADISDKGAVAVSQEGSTTLGDALGGDQLVYTGACTVYSTMIYGLSGSSAKDYALVYDALTATGSAVFDISIGVSGDTNQLRFNGVPFSTGIYVDVIDDGVHVWVEYD